MPKKANQSSLGKALQKQQQKKTMQGIAKVQMAGQFYHESKDVKENYQVQTENLESIVDQNPLNEYLQMAEMANVKYETEKKKGEIVQHEAMSHKQVIINVNALRAEQLVKNQVFDHKRNQLMSNLQIPRRPIWNEKTQVEELRQMENDGFLKWRKELAKFEEENYQIQLTPYEKNIEVWKQLWRVVEKSDILVQVVDARDILFYHCLDLVKYVNEEQNRIYRKNQTKLNFLLINKSDLMSEPIRQEWTKFLNEKQINHMFFSAKLEQEKIDMQEDEDDSLMNQLKVQPEEVGESCINTHNIATRGILLRELKHLVQNIRQQRKDTDEQSKVVVQPHGDEHEEHQVVIGMVGYPNVGKSSVINSLCNKKLVGVASRPGKTKHFQTLQLEMDLMLCDCPGLIFPNAASSRAEMVCNGVLPIDNIKDYLSPIDLLCQRIPKVVFEYIYGIDLHDVNMLDASSLLQCYSTKRGFVTGRALPDEAKAAKIMLKDFVNGRLLYCKLPYDYQGPAIWQSNVVEHLEELIQEDLNKPIKLEDEKVDQQFENQLISQKHLTNEEILDLFTQEDLVALMDGRRVMGVKLNKYQRREIKHSYQRGDAIDLRKYINLDKSQKEQVYVSHIQGKEQPKVQL